MVTTVITLTYVSSVLMAQGWMKPEIIAEDTRLDGVMGLSWW